VLRPLKSIRAIPANFFKNVLLVDFVLPPRFFAGSEGFRDKATDLYRFISHVFGVLRAGARHERSYIIIPFALSVIIMLIPVTIAGQLRALRCFGCP
jgi:hypothetical protein